MDADKKGRWEMGANEKRFVEESTDFNSAKREAKGVRRGAEASKEARRT